MVRIYRSKKEARIIESHIQTSYKKRRNLHNNQNQGALYGRQ